jgi:hypothetical protein
MKRMRKVAALALALVLFTAGCGVVTLPPTNVTASSATLRAQVMCSFEESGWVGWEVRAPGGAWKAAGRRAKYSCGRKKKQLKISKTVTGLKAGTSYHYRLVADPMPKGGFVLYTGAGRLTTRSAGGNTTPAGISFTPGVVATGGDTTAIRSLGADVVRVEFDIGTPVAQMRQTVGAIASAGARPLLLAGFEGRLPSVAEAQNLAGWAAEFGPGGRFWAGRSDGARAVRQIEFGNETSGSWQYGDTYADASYAARAETYATRFAQAHQAIAMTGRPVGLLAQADDGGSASPNWVNHMFRAVPNLGSLVDGWTVHPYGPRERWKPKLDRLIQFTAARGASPRIPIDVTEWGISSSNGGSLSDNYGWPANMTWAQAAAALRDSVNGMRADRAIGPRLRLFILYRVYDLNSSLPAGERERWFGALQNNLAEKGAYTAEVRKLFAQ